MSLISERKAFHLELCATQDVEARDGTLLDDVHLVHEALPELSFADVDLSTEIFGRELLAPITMSGMTGGTPEARELNRALATAAQKLGLGMGVGSQRVMLDHPDTVDTFRVRDVAPDILLLANLGAVQVRDSGVRAVAGLVDDIGADALCVHLNPAQELVQDGGDRDFRGCLDAIAELTRSLRAPVIVKETGCGMSPSTLHRLRAVGVTWVDVAGSGGTTWTGVESLRGSVRQRALGATLREWGIPTAAALVYARRAGLRAIASGGIRSAADAARALALGADAVGMALPLLRAFRAGGMSELIAQTEQLIEGLRALCVLTGSPRASALRDAPRVLGPQLRSWID